MTGNVELVESMIGRGVLKSERIKEAFLRVDRAYFVPEEFREMIYVDRPLPIGEGQTISQPSTVAFMLELLGVDEGDNVLDIGSGSGWTTALLCYLVGESGKVVGLERVDELVKMGRENLSKMGFAHNCEIQKAKERLGMEGEKFDKILISASAKSLPRELFDQLEVGGVMVLPIENSIFRFEKRSEDEIATSEYEGFVFVPLIH
jgi:protein-L-isoaspartate(D-aspartate) O-methyltransferase